MFSHADKQLYCLPAAESSSRFKGTKRACHTRHFRPVSISYCGCIVGILKVWRRCMLGTIGFMQRVWCYLMLMEHCSRSRAGHGLHSFSGQHIVEWKSLLCRCCFFLSCTLPLGVEADATTSNVLGSYLVRSQRNFDSVAQYTRIMLAGYTSRTNIIYCMSYFFLVE